MVAVVGGKYEAVVLQLPARFKAALQSIRLHRRTLKKANFLRVLLLDLYHLVAHGEN
jgi:hypothetical protein